MNKIIVTGGAGFIGSHTSVELLRSGFVPIIVDDFSNTDERILSGLKEIIGTEPVIYKIDCAREDLMREVFAKEKPIAAIHFAAFKAVGESMDEPLRYYHNNIASLITLLKLMEEFSVTQLVFSSSCTVYGQPDQLPVTEVSPEQMATSPYGFTKQVCERIIRDTQHARPSLKCALLRYFNPIGAHPSGLIGELPNGVPNNLVPYITQTAAGLREKLTVFGNDYDTADGTCIRDFIHVVDLAKAHVKALEWLAGDVQSCEAFNIGQGIGNSVLEVIKTFVKVTGQNLNYEIGPRRNGDVEKVWADVTKANEHLHWKTELSLDQALEDAWRWQIHLGK
jgi:UDP-glucose 4-epimerase